MRRGEIYLVNLDPALDSEANKKRPAIVVSNNGANSTALRLGRGVVSVIPVTRNITHIYPFQVFLSSTETGLNYDSKAQAEQIRSLSTKRIDKKIGVLSQNLIIEVDNALRLHLDL